MIKAYLKTFLPWVMIRLTGQPRYLPEIEWSGKSWVHNIFRVYELIFWRRHGIRAEETTICEEGVITHQFHSFESVLAGLETWIRNFKLVPFRIHVPILATPFGSIPASPYLFAIAIDAEADSALGSFSKTCTGSNLILMFGILKVPDASMAITYNSVSATLVTKSANVSTESVHMFYLIAPATGSNTVDPAPDPNYTYATSYTGAAQTGQMDASATAQPTATTVTVGLTSVANNCWGVVIVRNDTATVAVTSGPISTARGTAITTTWRDTNAAVSAGSQSTVYNDGGPSCGWCSVGASIAPFVASGPAAVKTWNGLAQASVKTVNALAMGSIKTKNGLA